MTNQDMDFLARKIVSLENKHNALARARQLPNSSVRLIDGSDVSMRDSAESGSDNRSAIEQLEGATTGIGSITDTEAENAVSVPEWFNELGVGVDVAWDSTQFATDLALQLETELGEAQLELDQALIDLDIAMTESAEAKADASQAVSDAQQAVADAAQAISDALTAANAAAAADGKAVAAQSAAGTAQSAADQAALDAATAAGIAEGKGKVIIQTSAPAVADRLPQNLWIDTTGGNNTPKRWDGSNWVVVTDKAATDAAAAAVTAQDRADEAYNEALSAATAAGIAQASADGKTTNWYQNDAPAGTAHKVGDTWFDTNDGNRIYRWNGSWVAAQFGTNAISDTAINAAKLANNAVTEGKILNGAITNDKLNSAVQNAITTAQSTASNAQTVANSAQSVANAAQTAASNAQDDADQAIADALAAANAASAADGKAVAAQNTANAKGKVIIQSAAPAAADRLVQNLWIDTTGGANTPKRWVSGTTWAVVTDKAATDAAAAAVTAQNAASAAQSRADDAHTIASGAATAASAAASAASAAQTAANNAQTTANGKNKIVRSTADASSPGNYVAGDQWWKYSGSQITAMWIHSGSAWVSQTLTDSVITNLNAGSITAGTIASARLSATNIKAVLINAGAIETANIAAGAITAASGIIADAAIGTAKIIDGSITTAKIKELAVTNAEIANGTIQNAKIANLDAAKINTGTLNAARIGAGSVTTEKIAALAVTAAELSANAVTAVKIAASAVTAEKINAGAVTTVKLDALAVTAEKIAAGAIIADKIAANAITTAKLAATAIDGMTITGALIRTAATGQRLQMDVNGLRAFNASGTETARLAADVGGLVLSGPIVSRSGTTGPRATLSEGYLIFDDQDAPRSLEILPGQLLSTDSNSFFTIQKLSSALGTGLNLIAGVSPSNSASIALSGADGGEIFFDAARVFFGNGARLVVDEGLVQMSSGLTVGTTQVDLPGLSSGTLSLRAGDVVHIEINFDVTGNASAVFTGIANVNGSNLGGQAILNGPTRATSTQKWRYVAPTTGNYVFKARGATTTGTVIVSSVHSRLSWLVMR